MLGPCCIVFNTVIIFRNLGARVVDGTPGLAIVDRIPFRLKVQDCELMRLHWHTKAFVECLSLGLPGIDDFGKKLFVACDPRELLRQSL